ncbi:glycosyltransferase [Providencia sp. 2024EL-00732]|uniref:glycosyltransferase n=1 Tax=Providencia sp. 2024EL-00732 TaxID=3374242 RepID=UPI0024AA9C82|nr:glycosyltransferase [Providencia rettgeri]
MRIDFLINSLKGGGTEKVCVSIANKLVEEGWKVNLHILDDSGSYYDVKDGVILNYLGKTNTLQSPLKIVKLLKDKKIKKILIFNHELALVAYLVKKITFNDTKLITRLNNTLSIAIKSKKKSYQIVITTMMKLFYRHLDFYIFQSTGIKEDTIKNYNVSRDYKIINNPIGTVLSVKEKSQSKTKELLYIGRLVPQKNVIDILKAIKLLIRNDIKVHLSIVGDGIDSYKLNQYCENEKIENHVTFHGYQKRTSSFYSQADLTILSSINEGFPNVLLESLSHLTPVVSYDTPSGPKEIIQKGVNGFLVPYMDYHELANFIELALNHEWSTQKISKSIAKYNISHIVNEYKDVFKKFD